MNGKTAEILELSSLSVVQAALNVPVHYLKLISDAQGIDITKKEMGFIVRRSDIQALRSYVREARTLPVSLKVIQEQLGYQTINIPELEPASIQAFHERVVAHAGTWDDLEHQTKELARKLDRFSSQYLLTGDRLLLLIEKSTPELFINGTLKDLTDAQKDELAQLDLGVNTKNAVPRIKNYLERMKASAQDYIKEVDKVGDLAVVFERELTEQLISKVKLKVQAYESSPLMQEQTELLDGIKELDRRIDELAQEYKRHVGLAFSGIALGPLGLIVSGGIYGSKAEKSRALKNEAIKERRVLREKSKDTQRVIKLLDGVQLKLSDLSGRMHSAEVGAKQLSQVWRFIEEYLEDLIGELENINYLAELHHFALEFSLVLDPWRKIKGYSSDISRAFNDLLEDAT